jgi:hypothetical protein
VLSYQLDNFLYQGGEVVGIGKEHCFYHHNPNALTPRSPAIVHRNVTMKWAGRTAIQVVSRVHEGPGGQGNVLIENCRIEDVCLEDQGGGSALTFRGNLDGTVLIRQTRVHLGGNPRLHPSVGRNITGALVMDCGSGTGGRGTRDLFIDGCHFEVGPHYVGKGSARRPNLQISDVGKVILKETTVRNHPGAAAALSIELASIGELLLDAGNKVIGDCILPGVGNFPDPRRTGAGYRALLEAVEAESKEPGSVRNGALLRKVRLFDSSH